MPAKKPAVKSVKKPAAKPEVKPWIPPPTTVADAIQIAEQLRPDQGREKLVAFLRGL